MRAPAIMVQGTTSHAGKTVLVAALCRTFARRGLSVAPFKGQNMALNSAVTPEGAEIGRAQAFQARAAGVECHADMNPVLLKPCSQTGSQVIVMGKPVGTMGVHQYHAYQEQVWPDVTAALERLRSRHDLVVIEGAGSPAEVNIRHRDIANMSVALAAEAPVLLVADIDRGGVFASIVGTMELLTPEERALVRGIIINRFRGDASLLDPGLAMLEERYGIPVLGVLPYLEGWRGEEEDSLGIEDGDPPDAEVAVAVVRLPFVSNFTDVDALLAEPDVAIRWARRPEDLAGSDAIILPGSKSTADDLRWLRESGLADAIVSAAHSGTPVVGLCGGYQMLGKRIDDPLGIEGGGSIEGLGLLDTVTTFEPEKRTINATGTTTDSGLLPAGLPAIGYEIHMGRTEVGPEAAPLLHLHQPGDERPEGATSPHHPVCGTYLHGLFDSPPLRRSWLDGLRDRKGLDPVSKLVEEVDPCDRLADLIETHLDMPAVEQLLVEQGMEPVAWGSADDVESGETSTVGGGEAPKGASAAAEGGEASARRGLASTDPNDARPFVYLIGAGPGDADLITRRGLDRLRRAEVVLYDHLIDQRLLDEVPNAELIDVGKRGWHVHMTQPEIDELLVAKALEDGGRIVARLKGGDPFVFGRGGEEALALVEAGIPFEVVPGVTAAVAVGACARIPLTHRGVSSSLTLVTGHEDPTKPGSDIDWEALAHGGTLCFYMGVKNLSAIAENLVANGRSPETPVALVRWCGTERQEMLTATLADVADTAAERGFSAPAIIVVGDVVRIGERLRDREGRTGQ